MKEENKEIKIGLGTVICIVIILLLVIAIIGLGVYIHILKNNYESVDIKTKEENILDSNERIKTDNEIENKIENSSADKDITNEEKTSDNKMSIELAYGILNKYKTEKLSDENWYIGNVKLVAHGDNNSYWVSYEEINKDGYKEDVATIIQYKNSKWIVDLPGSSGMSDEEIKKYNFVNYKDNEKLNETDKEMNIELAYGILNKYKNEKLSDENWYIGNVKLVAHGDNNSYWVSYEEVNKDGYKENVAAIIQYKNNKWIADLPGSSGMSDEELKKFNFVDY